MHNIKTNFEKFLGFTKSSLNGMLRPDGNLQFYPRPPKMDDCSIIALSICAEALGIDSENHLWGQIKKDHAADFPNLIDRSNFNRRRRRLQLFIHETTRVLSARLNEGEDVFVVDSIPVLICNIAREKQNRFRTDSFESKADKGFSAITESYYYGYKLHLVTSVRGVFHSMGLSKASVHDVRFLQDIKHSGMNNATLIGDKGYISKEQRTGLFHTCRVTLETPRRSNQKKGETWHPVFRKCRKRIETLFSQPCDQMMLKRNYAKSLDGLRTRLFSKIAAVTILQSMNCENKKPLNHLKHALAA